MKKQLPILLILLLAFGLRVYALTSVPPGLTHDEANHGREAIEILDGVFRYFFPLNYGSEPVYSYTVAGSMALLGEGLFALRYVNVIFGILAMAVSFRWAKWAFDKQIALVGLAVTAVSFWPLASSREALRAGMLPFFMAGAVWFFWRMWHKERWGAVWLFAISLVVTFHIYLAARVTWLLFPLFIAYLFVWHKDAFRRAWGKTAVGLFLTALLVAPMFIYLQNNPDFQTRVSMLDGSLGDILGGNWQPVLSRFAEALLAFGWAGYGDQFLAYNIPGRPVLDVLTALFFVAGILVCVWRIKRPSYAFLLLWFFVGISPSLITGATAGTTRNLAALPAVHLLPAVGFWAIVEGVKAKTTLRNNVAWGATAVWLTLTLFITSQDYFVHWAQDPDVRGAYQINLLAGLDVIEDNQQTIISTVYPGPAHDSSIGLVLTGELHQFIDARYGFLIPNQLDQPTQLLIPQSTPPHPAFAPLLKQPHRHELRPTDLDPYFEQYLLDTSNLNGWLAEGDFADVNFGNALSLIEARWLTETVSAGHVAELLTIWRITDPAQAGTIVPPAFTTDAVFFTQVLHPEGGILAQRDSLDVPSWTWKQGDLVLQVHSIVVPVDAIAHPYDTIVGIYDRQPPNSRLMVIENGEQVRDWTAVPPLLIQD